MSFRGLVLLIISLFSTAYSAVKPLPAKIEEIMQQNKYQHANWGILVKDATSGQILYEKNSNQFFLPGSTTKLFTMAALVNAYGEDYRFKTPVYAIGSIKNGILKGNLVLVGQGDLTFGGRQTIGSNHIAYTKMDHIYANYLPGVVLTKQNPLNALNELAKEIKERGILRIDGDILIDDRLFDTMELRGLTASPIIINENLIDIVLHPTTVGQLVEMTWRPQVKGYHLVNTCKTVPKSEPIDISIHADKTGRTIYISGTIPEDEQEQIRTFTIQNPRTFARDAFIQALKAQGIVIKEQEAHELPPQSDYRDIQPIAVWVSPPLHEYVKLVLKVSHNLGANLAIFLLAAQKNEKTFDAGMLELGKFTTNVVRVSADSFVFNDGAGGDENRLTPQAELKLLDYVRTWPEDTFKHYYDGLPIPGVNGSLEDFAKGSPAVGKVYAKTGTGISTNLALNQFFLPTQALTGYIQGKNGHLLEFMIAVNNGNMPKLDDIYAIFEDECQMTAELYRLSAP